jgi:SAM-dependent methyltransferase
MSFECIDMSAEKEKLMREYPQGSCESVLLKNVVSAIYKNDDMYAGNAARYLTIGLSAIQCINDSISRAKDPRIETILDMPCGYGRVLRLLCQRFPHARITGMDIAENAVDFCTHTFGSRGIYSKKELNSVKLGCAFDMIWCGSLLTHLNARLAVDLLHFLNRHLSAGGILIFTSHGPFVRERIKNGEKTYGLDAEGIAQLLRSYDESGYGYADYPGQADYGISVSSAGWLRGQFKQIRGWTEIYGKERGWADHQDVFCILKGRNGRSAS